MDLYCVLPPWVTSLSIRRIAKPLQPLKRWCYILSSGSVRRMTPAFAFPNRKIHSKIHPLVDKVEIFRELIVREICARMSRNSFISPCNLRFLGNMWDRTWKIGERKARDIWIDRRWSDRRIEGEGEGWKK